MRKKHKESYQGGIVHKKTKKKQSKPQEQASHPVKPDMKEVSVMYGPLPALAALWELVAEEPLTLIEQFPEKSFSDSEEEPAIAVSQPIYSLEGPTPDCGSQFFVHGKKKAALLKEIACLSNQLYAGTRLARAVTTLSE